MHQWQHGTQTNRFEYSSDQKKADREDGSTGRAPKEASVDSKQSGFSFGRIAFA